jgi:ABC-type nitrate/sulfonate/bicarbonate transport system substrate-binding protein
LFGAGSRPLVVFALSALLLSACGSAAPAAKPAAASHSSSPASSAASAPSSSGQAAPAGSTSVTFAMPAISPDFAFIFLARDLGFFKKYGIDAKLVAMKPPTAVAGVQSGKVTFTTVIGSSTSAALRGLPLRVVLVAMNYPDWLLVGKKGLTNVSQLRGQVVAGNVTPADTVTVSTVDLLKADGLPPGSYKLLLLGTSSPAAHLAALSNGRIAATMLDLTVALKAKADGFPVLARFWPAVATPNDGLVTSLSEIQNHPKLMSHVLSAVEQALQVVRTDPSRGYPYIEKDFHLTAAQTKAMFQTISGVWTTNGIPSTASVQNQLQQVAQQMKLKATPTESQVYDLAPLRAVLKASSAA